MPKQTVRIPLQGPSPVFQIVSHGRKGRHTPLHLSHADVEAIARTVGGTPEVVVKVSGGGRTAQAAKAHLDYIGRHGKLEIETDEGQRLQGRQAGAWLTDDWNLALSKGQYREVRPGEPDRRPKVVHNLVFSMTKGTPPEKLLAATRVFAREQFALRHRYAMVLHTDQDHPHVHVAVKAESEHGERLYIRKATLRQWRETFAACLRAQGVAAIATPGAARGKVRDHKKDAIYQRMREIRAYQALPDRERRTRRPPVACRYLNAKVEAVAKALKAGQPIDPEGTQKLTRTRHAMAADWTAIAHQLASQGEAALAGQVRQMAAALPPPITQGQQIARALRQSRATSGVGKPSQLSAGHPDSGKSR
jgi:type IV secretory pathway VirD2 relaxase